MSETDFEEQVMRRLASLERQRHILKAGAITDVDVKKGIRIQWGTPDEDFKSPWIQPSRHAGYITESMPWKVGQTILSLGMDPEHRTALVFPHSPSDSNPPDKDASMTSHDYRIRDPAGAAGTQSGQAVSPPSQGLPGTQSGPAQKAPAKDDDDNDYKHTRTYLKHEMRLGAKLKRSATRDSKTSGHKIHDQVATASDASKFNSHTIDPLQILVQFASGLISHLLDANQFLAQAGNMLHSFLVHAQNGIQASANNGQHKTTWLNGITHTSSTQITHDAPITNINRILKVFNISQLFGGISTGAFEVEADAGGVPGKATINGALSVNGLGVYHNDAEAATAGVPINGVYVRATDGALMVRYLAGVMAASEGPDVSAIHALVAAFGPMAAIEAADIAHFT